MSTTEIIDDVESKRQLLEGARELDLFGRRLERFLLVQLQQLELAISSFERERAAWERQQRLEIAQLEQGKKALSEGCDHRSHEGLDGQQTRSRWWPLRGSAGPSITAVAPSHADHLGGRQPKSPAGLTGVAANACAPLRVLLQPSGASEFWLGALMVEISKLNWLLGGSGVRFEPVACRIPGGKLSSTDPQGLADVMIELEIFSSAPLLGEEHRHAPPDGPTAALLIWQEFKSRMAMTSLVDQQLAQHFRKAGAAPKNHEPWRRLANAAHRAEDANLKLQCGRSEAGAFNAGGEEQVLQQLKKIEVVAEVISKEHNSKLHISLV